MKKYALTVLGEAKRLHGLGFAILWLYPGKKEPVGFGWQKGLRKSWPQLEKEYQGLDPKFIGSTPGNYNVGVRVGEPSKINDRGYLCIVDVDVKSTDEKHRLEAYQALQQMQGIAACPFVESGRGGGSRHYYCVTKAFHRTKHAYHSDEIVVVHMPSAKTPHSARDKELCTPQQLEQGYRARPAWEISVMSGQGGSQVVLPPSVHPDSGKQYRWGTQFTDVAQLPLVAFEVFGGDEATPKPRAVQPKPEIVENTANPGNALSVRAANKTSVATFKAEDVSFWTWSVSTKIRRLIQFGEYKGQKIADRSAYLPMASRALLDAGLTLNEAINVLTDPDTFLGQAAYDHTKSNSRKRAAQWVFDHTVKTVSQAASAQGVFTKASEMPKTKKLTAGQIKAQNEDIEEERNWKQDIICNQQGVPAKNVQNVVHIICHAVNSKVVMRDKFAYRDTYSCDTPWGGEKGNCTSDDDVANLKYWLGCNYSFEPASNVISDALIVLATQNAFDPVKDMLDGLPVWDNVKRLDDWLRENFEAEGEPEYTAQVFRKWMVAMVMRIYEPGAKFDWMPIFEGKQGVGKSSFGRLLVGDKYFLDWLPNLHDKDSALGLQGMWAVEMGELSQFRGNDLENIKAFITRQVDKVRPPYGKRSMEIARRCVFFGTTNKPHFLMDETGNRRFKPLKVGRLNFANLERDRLQLFAEAKWLYDEKIESEQTMALTGIAREYERGVHEEKMVRDDSHVMEELMEDFIHRVEAKEVVLKGFTLDKFQMKDLFMGVGPLTNHWKVEKRTDHFAAKMLKRIGYYKDEKAKSNGRRFWQKIK